MNLKGKVVIVTGAKSGIGLATAGRFADEGARVVVADIREASQEVGELVKRGTEAIFVQVDVGDASQVAAMIEKTVAAFGRLDILVNNAGIELARKVTDTTEAEWERLMNVNLKGVFLCSKSAIPVMQRNGGGVFVYVAGTGVEQVTPVANEFALLQNYPNPFNPVTTIEYRVQERCEVVLKVYDVAGREVATLVQGPHQLGMYRVRFDAAGLASGE